MFAPVLTFRKLPYSPSHRKSGGETDIPLSLLANWFRTLDEHGAQMEIASSGLLRLAPSNTFGFILSGVCNK